MPNDKKDEKTPAPAEKKDPGKPQTRQTTVGPQSR
jgi:hypothetical protein